MKLSNLYGAFLLLACLAFATDASAQLETRFSMAATITDVSSPTATTHQATLTMQADQLGAGYLANQVQVGWRLLTATGREYEITAVPSSNFSSATVTLLEIEGTTLGPSGVGVVYEYDGTTRMIPPLPANAQGISQALLARMLIHNFEVATQELAGGSSTVETQAPVTGDGSAGNPITYTRPLPTWAELVGKPTIFPSGDDDPTDEYQDPTYNPATGELGLTNSDETVTVGSRIKRTGNSYGTDMSITVWHFGEEEPTFSGDATTGYQIDCSCTALKIAAVGNSDGANASGTAVFRFTGRLADDYSYQMYDQSNNQKVDVHLTGNVPKQDLQRNLENRFEIPNIGGNYPNYYRAIWN
jgi:hypothetical protein